MAKSRRKLWKDLAKMHIKGKWYLLGDFNMVKKKRNSLNAPFVILGSKKNLWKELKVGLDGHVGRGIKG